MKLLKVRNPIRYEPETVFLQRLLNDEASRTFLAEDGLFGPRTEAAVYDFQEKQWHLKSDGIAGPKTWGAFRLTVELTIRVQLLSQYNAETCWSAAAGMLHGRRMSAAIGGGEYGTNPDGSRSRGMVIDRVDPEPARKFADSHGFTMVSHQSWTPGAIRILLMTRGALMVLGLTRNNNLHAWIVSGMWDRAKGRTMTTAVRIHDPWPPGKGNIYPVFWGDNPGWISHKWFYILHR